MRRNVFTGTCLLALCLLWGCGGSVGGIRQDVLAYQGQDVAVGKGSVPVSILVDGGAATSRTIAPEHISQTDLGDTSKYTLTMDGHSDMGGSVAVPNFTLRDGRGILALSPGAWTLRLTATNVATSTQFLSGSTLLVVQDAPTTASITLSPLTGTGTVSVGFTIPQSVVKWLDPTTGNQKQVTVALYDTTGQLVQGTGQTFTVAAGTTNPATINYTANGAVASGRYILRLTAPYTVNNASTGNQNVTYNLGWSDILYVEQGRESATTVAIPEAGSSLGVPGTPHRRDKAMASVTVARAGTAGGNSAHNITTGNQTFNPYGEGLWIYAANWDGDGEHPGGSAGQGGNRGNTAGNEVLLVDWDTVYDADYYELEMLLHPNFGGHNNVTTSNAAKYETLPVSDTDWDSFKTRIPAPLQLRWSGSPGDPDYYKIKTYTYTITNGTQTNVSFDFLAWQDLADGRNGGFKVASAPTADGTNTFIHPPDTSTGLSRRGSASYRIGLEGDCDALAVLVNSFAPQHWYGIRLRAVNRYGHSDWVYWKGGKN